MRTQAIFFTGVNQIEVGWTDIPDPGPSEVLVRTRYSCISPGTELRNLGMPSDAPGYWPFITGYAMVGEVIARGAQTQLSEGTLVFCKGTSQASHQRMWGGHMAHAVLPEHSVFPLPQGVDPLEASLAKLCAITLHGSRLSKPLAGEAVAVVGLGPIGQLAARVHAISGARVVATDLSPARVAVAHAAGIEAIVPRGDLASAFADMLPNGADIVVDATGAPRVLPQALAIAKTHPWDAEDTVQTRLLIQGSYPGDFSVPYTPAFVRELAIHIPRDNTPRDLRDTLVLMQRNQLRARDLISDVRAPADAARTYAELRATPDALMTVAFEWSGG